MGNTKHIDALVLLLILLLGYYAVHAQRRGMDELDGHHKPIIPSGICYEQKHPCIGPCWCCLGDDYKCYSTQDECKGNCTEI
ncbi:hypothetical protein PVAP13_2KG164916 [Panicum virgatum]|uniref:Meg domain-containing protein n=1 Tax=Panicum virgatum TaxID=38727 RepID=A0A8T0W5I7_PANVG|nr:hypothetical protein PVAP13_2KG164916 [Panicum virgatum]